MATTHKYPPVGRCIYCSSITSDLGDEHIIPFSLNGGMVLPKASCHSCERTIQPYELTVARRIFGHFRIRHGVQTRNKKQRPEYVEFATLFPNGKSGKERVPVHEYPTMLFVYKFDKATMLLCYPSEVEHFRWVPISIFNKTELDKFIEKHHWNKQTTIKTSPVELARLIAKIAYSFAVAEIGLDSFLPLPMTLDTILCRTNNVSYSVGGDWEIPPPDPAGKHVLNLTCIIQQPNPLIVVEIRLFPAFETPKYHVVVGHFDMQNPNHFRTFTEKMREAQ